MTTRVKLGAKRDGTLTAIEIHVVSNTGAYGGHASETLAASLGSPLTAYRCANKKADGYAVYTNMVPGGGFRGYGASQTTFAIECAMDELARLLGMDPFEIRRKNMVRPGRLDRVGLEGSLRRRLRQLRARPMPRPGREGAWPPAAAPRSPTGDEWAEGTGIALAMLECGPPTEHRSGGADGAAGRRHAITSPSARPRWATARSPRTGRSRRRSSARGRTASPSSTPTPI